MSRSSALRCLTLMFICGATPGPNLIAQGVASFSSASPYFGVYFGKFENGGRWAMAISWDNLARFDFIGRLGSGLTVSSYPYSSELYDGGQFQGFTPFANEPITGKVENGAVTGSVAGHAFSGQVDRADGPGAAYRGYWWWSDWRQPSVMATRADVVVGPSGTTLVHLKTPFQGDEDGFTTIVADGTFSLTLTGGTRVSGRIDPIAKKLEVTLSLEGTPLSKDGRMANISMLGFGTDGASRYGFTVAGGAGKRVLFRALGSQLSMILGPGAYLENPMIELGTGPTRIAVNDDWDAKDPELHRAMAQVGALPFMDGSKDAAFVATLAPGNYWLNVHSADWESLGKVLVEIFDLEPRNGSLLNFAAQGFVGREQDELISGFVISGDEPRVVLVRAVGPGAAPPGGFNPNPLADPQLEVRNSAGVIVAANDDWSSLDSPLLAAAQKAGTFRLEPGSKNAALLVTLAPGAYTATVRGSGGTTGNALVEIYDSAVLPPVTKARLVVDAFTVTRTWQGEYFSYQPRVRLVEKSGVSAATIVTVSFNFDELGARSGPPWNTRKTVPAGGTQELIEILYGEPELELTSTSAPEILSMVITFVDQDGRVDSIAASARVTR